MFDRYHCFNQCGFNKLGQLCRVQYLMQNSPVSEVMTCHAEGAFRASAGATARRTVITHGLKYR